MFFLSLDEIVLALHKRIISASRSALSRFFARQGITIKKSLRAAYRKRDDVARKRRRWIREQGLLDPTRLVFIDETAVTANMVPSQRLEPARRTPYWRGSNGTLRNADIHRWLPQNRHRG